MWKSGLLLTSAVALTGCLETTDLNLAAERQFAALQDQPFDEGAVSVLTEEHGELHTYKLRTCRNATHICGSRAGHLAKTPDYSVVTGAFPGRTFYLSPGGDGYMKRSGALIPLAWNE